MKAQVRIKPEVVEFCGVMGAGFAHEIREDLGGRYTPTIGFTDVDSAEVGVEVYEAIKRHPSLEVIEGKPKKSGRTVARRKS